MTGLASLRVERQPLLRGRRCDTAPRTASAPGFVQAQTIDRWHVDALDVDRPVGGIRSRVSPVGAPVCSRNRNRLNQCRRGEQPLIACVRQTLSPRLALFHAQDVWIQIVSGEALQREWRRVRGEGLRWPRLFAGNVALRNRTLLDWPQRLAGDAIENVEEPRLACL